ncbi:hypothetical protein ACLOJK_005386 [Asimina triloba]
MPRTPCLGSYYKTSGLPSQNSADPHPERWREMAWSAENATEAYLRTVKMVSTKVTAPVHLQRGKEAKEPHMSEFISALAAGNSAQLMVEACSGAAGATTLALVVASQQTGGRVVCIVSGLEEVRASEESLGVESHLVEYVVGDARLLLLNQYRGADFVLIDCNLEEQEEVLRAAQQGPKPRGAVIMGYNAFHHGPWWGAMRTHLLPIGDGLLVTRVPPSHGGGGGGRLSTGSPKKGRWVVRIDECTGEEHVFRIRSPHRKELEA